MSAAPPGDAAVLAAWVDLSDDPMAATDRQGRLLATNRRFVEALGGGDGMLAELVASGAEGDPTRRRLADALGGAGLHDAELLFGARRFRARATVAGDRIVWVLRDVTAERALADEASHLRELLDMAQEFGRLGVWERDLATGTGRWDRHVFGFWGRDPALGTPSHEEATSRIHPDDRPSVQFPESIRRAGRYAMRYRVVQPDGSLRWVHSQWEVKNGPDGQPVRAVGIMMDDTEVYELARSLGDASAQLKLAVELADIAIWRHDLRTDRMHYNDRAYAVLGIPAQPDGMALEEVRALIHPDDVPEVIDSARRALASDRPTDMQARYRRSDGSWRHVLTRRVVQRAADGSALGFVGVALDVTEQVERQRRALELASRLEIAAGASGIGIWTRDPATDTGEWNARMFELYGRSPSLGVPNRREWLGELVHPEDRARMSDTRERLLAGTVDTVEHEYRIVRPDGEVRWLVVRARREAWDGRTMICGVTLDQTERRRTEQALRSADQRAALAARSAGIGTWEVDFDSGAERWDEQMFRLRGLEPAPRPPPREQRLALLHPDDRAYNVDAQATALREGRPARYEFRVVLPAGGPRAGPRATSSASCCPTAARAGWPRARSR